MFERNISKIVLLLVFLFFFLFVIIVGFLIGYGEKVKFSGNGLKWFYGIIIMFKIYDRIDI